MPFNKTKGQMEKWRSLALMVCELWCFEDLEEKDILMNE